MRMYDLIEKKKAGEALTKEEIRYIVREFTEDRIPEYQMAAMLMAICFKGMTDEEMTELTLSMASSGEMADLSAIQGIKVDKHSTGGVGDKTTLIVGPIVASLGVKVAKVSGRGLGHTGGTVDKMESIPGMRTAIPKDEFYDIVNRCNIAVIGQSGNMVPADKKLYALRDVTATIDSVPLIAASIMSKKIAAGSCGIVLDVKTGSGAFMKTLDDSIRLAEKMVAIGTRAGRRCCALITDMDIPLGYAVGNSLEVAEAVETLKGSGPEDLTFVCLELASAMLFLAGKGTMEECRAMARKAIEDGSALKKLIEMVECQGGDSQYVKDPGKFKQAEIQVPVKAVSARYIQAMDAEEIGLACVGLGAGRSKKEDVIDMSAGIRPIKKYGDYVEEGDTLAVLYTSDEKRIKDAAERLTTAYKIGEEKPKERKLVYARITDRKEILRHVDHTQLAQTAGWESIRQLCEEAMAYGTASVCIPPSYIRQAKQYVGENMALCTVIGFPNGYSSTEVKVFETEQAVKDGADEIDMVINLGWVKDGLFDQVEQEIRKVKAACGGKILKVIIETCLLTREEKIRMCQVVTSAQADYIKTSTGFSTCGATFEDVELLAEHVGEDVKIKAAGGISTLEDARRFLRLGASRLGSSRVIRLVREAEEA